MSITEMSYNPLVSCIVPTHNRSDLITGAILSIHKQTYDNIEIIVVNDSSTDKTEQKIGKLTKKYDKIHYYTCEKGCPMKSRNYGVSKASGDVVAFLDDDDRWCETKLEKQVPFLQEYSLVSALAEIKTDDGSRVQKKNFEQYKTVEYNDAFMGIPHLYPSATICSKEDYEKIGGFSPQYVEWDFYLKMIKRAGSAIVIGEPLVRFDRSSISRWSNRTGEFHSLMRTYQHNVKNVPSHIAHKRLSNIYFEGYRISDSHINKIKYLLLAYYYAPNNIHKRVYCKLFTESGFPI